MRLPINRKEYISFLKKEYTAEFNQTLPEKIEKRILKDTAYFYTMYSYCNTNTPYFFIPFVLLNCAKEYQDNILKYFGITNYKGQKILLAGRKIVLLDRQKYWDMWENDSNFFDYLNDMIENYLFG